MVSQLEYSSLEINSIFKIDMLLWLMLDEFHSQFETFGKRHSKSLGAD
jgi:hypothetical protein